jgi:hypothetical protein
MVTNDSFSNSGRHQKKSRKINERKCKRIKLEELWFAINDARDKFHQNLQLELHVHPLG